MNSRIRCLFFVVLMVSGVNTDSLGQPGTGPNDGAAPGAAPIGGIEILIGLGGLLGAKKIFDNRKKN